MVEIPLTVALLLGGTERPAWLRPRTIAARDVIVQVVDAELLLPSGTVRDATFTVRRKPSP